MDRMQGDALSGSAWHDEYVETIPVEGGLYGFVFKNIK